MHVYTYMHICGLNMSFIKLAQSDSCSHYDLIHIITIYDHNYDHL